jgi:predicted amidophosphoribosyltransferase
MVTVEQYREASAAFHRRLWRVTNGLLAFYFAIAVAFAALVGSYGDAFAEAWVRWTVGRGIQFGLAPPITSLVGLLLILLLTIPAVGLMRFSDRRARRDRRLFCPYCDAQLGSMAAVTGNCQGCGKRVLELAQEGAATAAASPGSALPRVTAEEFNAALRSSLKRLGVALAVAIFAMFAYMGVLAVCREPLLDWLARQVGEARARDALVLFVLPVLGLFFGPIIVAAIWDSRRRAACLNCPQCQAGLDGSRWPAVVATRRCPCCQTPVLRDPEADAASGDAPAIPTLTLDALKAAGAAYRRRLMFC